MQTLGFSSKIYVKVWKYRPEDYPSLAPYSSRDMPRKHNKTDETVTDFTKLL